AHLGAVTAQGENIGINGLYEVAANAFDDNIGTKWLDSASNSTHASWIQYRYPNAEQYLVTNYTLTSANDAPDRDPANWALLGSNDGGTSWATLDVQMGQVFPSRFQTRTFSVANPGAYNLYRLRIDSVDNPSTAIAVQLAE